MKTVLTSKSVEIPAEIKNVSVKARKVTIEGERGVLQRDFRHYACDLRLVKSADGKRTILLDVWFGTRKQVAGARTIETHIRNMILGVTKGFVRKMRFVYAHFPIQCSLPTEDPLTGAKVEEGKIVEVRNFLGEHRVRRVDMLPGVICKRGQKDEIILIGNDLEMVSQTAARINQCILVHNKDIRKFLDGCYVSEKCFATDLEA